MARLLLVDDNPSIHKIAETLLGPSYVELVCVDSAEAALALVESGESFDIALLDTTMPGMDGWELLARLRAHPATSRIPVAMMAGVLDTVDPERLANAPIQGFLKKPIELRDLPDRVRKLLATPVSGTGTFPIHAAPASLPEPAEMPEPVEMPEFVPTQRDLPDPSPFATQPPGTRLPDYSAPDPSELETQPPGTKLSDLHGMGGVDPGDLITLPPGTKLADLPGLSAMATTPGLELDLLLLTPDDLLHEEPAAPEPHLEPSLEPELEFEELDLDSLRGLPLEPGPGAALPEETPAPAILENEPFDLTPPSGWSPAAQAAPTWEELPEVPALAPPAAAFPMDLPELAAPAGGFEVVTGEVLGVPSSHPAPLEAAPAPAPSVELPPIQTLDLDAGGVPSLEEWPALETEQPSSHPMAAALAAGGIAAGGFAAALPSSPSPEAAALPAPPPVLPAPAPRLGDGPEAQLVKAVLADPVLMDALARAVVAQLGDQALREIAWEVIPELAEKLHRPS